MKTAVKLRKDEKAMADSMRKYVIEIKSDLKKDPVLAGAEAKKALKRTGVIHSNGRPKKVIVSWE